MARSGLKSALWVRAKPCSHSSTSGRATNPRFWQLIGAFGRITGVPVLLNTSFNLRGEPIVCTPQDALRTFFTSGLDFLAMGNCLVAKDDVLFAIRSREVAGLVTELLHAQREQQLAEKTYAMTKDLFEHQAAARIVLHLPCKLLD